MCVPYPGPGPSVCSPTSEAERCPPGARLWGAAFPERPAQQPAGGRWTRCVLLPCLSVTCDLARRAREAVQGVASGTR